MTEDEIIESATRKEEEEGDGGEVPVVRLITHNAAIDSFATSNELAEENGVSTSDI